MHDNRSMLTVDEESTKYVYMFDGYTSNILRQHPVEHTRTAPNIYYFARDGYEPRKNRIAWETAALLLSLIKLAEPIAMWMHGSVLLGALSSIGWCFFYIFSLVLYLFGAAREFSKAETHHQVDVLEGDLPAIPEPGARMKIILGAPANTRTHVLWTVCWAIGSILCCVSLIGAYVVIPSCGANHLYLWAGFQVAWLVLRSAFFHLMPDVDDFRIPVLPAHPPYPKERLLRLAAAVSVYQAMRHPRRASSYELDTQDANTIMALIRNSIWATDWLTRSFGQLPASISKSGTLEIVAVIGDTMLSSLAWIYDLPYSGMDLYDSSLVILKVDGQQYLVPAVRALSGWVTFILSSSEAKIATKPGRVPRLGPNDGGNLGWVFWIAAGEGRWLHIVGYLDFLGKHHAEVLNDAEVTRRLELATLGLDLKDAREITDIATRAAQVGQLLMEDRHCP